jgi:hypothetical protein
MIIDGVLRMIALCQGGRVVPSGARHGGGSQIAANAALQW